MQIERQDFVITPAFNETVWQRIVETGDHYEKENGSRPDWVEIDGDSYLMLCAELGARQVKVYSGMELRVKWGREAKCRYAAD